MSGFLKACALCLSFCSVNQFLNQLHLGPSLIQSWFCSVMCIVHVHKCKHTTTCSPGFGNLRPAHVVVQSKKLSQLKDVALLSSSSSWKAGSLAGGRAGGGELCVQGLPMKPASLPYFPPDALNKEENVAHTCTISLPKSFRKLKARQQLKAQKGCSTLYKGR